MADIKKINVSGTEYDIDASKLNGKEDSAFVHIAGAETISGAKTFSSKITGNAGASIKGTACNAILDIGGVSTDTDYITLDVSGGSNNTRPLIIQPNSGKKVAIGNIPTPSEKLEVEGNIKVSGYVITSDPTADNQAATKKYVDEHSSNVDVDNSSITKNSSNQLQAVGVRSRESTPRTIKFLPITSADYAALTTKDADTLYYITDDAGDVIAVDVTQKINGKLISDIFESNGTTVKEATHAATADSATTATTATTANTATSATTADKLNSNVVNVTIPTTGWERSTEGIENMVTATGVTASNNIIVSPSSSITSDELTAWGTAQIMATGQGNNYITFTALAGTAPSVAIPVTVLILN